MARRHRCKDTVHRTRFSLENGYCESFNSKLRDEFLNGELFYSIKELRVLAERWRVHYNTVRPHSSLGYRPPAPEAWMTSTSWQQGEPVASLPAPLLPYPASIGSQKSMRYTNSSLVQNIGQSNLVQDNWDDFGYKTTFQATLHLSKTESIELGNVKILHKDQTKGFTEMPSTFERLGREYASTGGDTSYYEKLLAVRKTLAREYLRGIRDLAFSDRDSGEI